MKPKGHSMANSSFVFFVLVALVSGAATSRAEVCGQLAAVRGSGVEVLRMQPSREGERIRHGMRIEQDKVLPLECDDVILSGRDSSAKIILANGKLSLGPESRIEMAAHVKAAAASQLPKVSLINLTYGKMRALIQSPGASVAGALQKSGAAPAPKKVPAHFRVRTFSAVAGVRGTDFFTSYEPNTGLTEQATLEGSVEVQQAGTNQTVHVAAGKQVAVETTPAAVAAAAARRAGQDLEPPKTLPDAATAPKKLSVVPLSDSLRSEIRVASAIVKQDQEFAHPKAVQALGQPETWTLEREKVPEKLDQLKNEF